MNHPTLITIGKILQRKLFVVILLVVSAVTAFATLGDGKVKTSKAKRSLLSSRDIAVSNFSLKSGYTFRGSQVINTQQAERYINLNTVVTYQKGNTTYILPLKKKVLLDKVTFNPNSATRGY